MRKKHKGKYSRFIKINNYGSKFVRGAERVEQEGAQAVKATGRELRAL